MRVRTRLARCRPSGGVISRATSSSRKMLALRAASGNFGRGPTVRLSSGRLFALTNGIMAISQGGRRPHLQPISHGHADAQRAPSIIRSMRSGPVTAVGGGQERYGLLRNGGAGQVLASAHGGLGRMMPPGNQAAGRRGGYKAADAASPTAAVIVSTIAAHSDRNLAVGRRGMRHYKARRVRVAMR